MFVRLVLSKVFILVDQFFLLACRDIFGGCAHTAETKQQNKHSPGLKNSVPAFADMVLSCAN